MMIEGIGLHDIVIKSGLAINSQLAERTIKTCLLNQFGSKEIVDHIMVTYYRLLFYPMLVEGEKELYLSISGFNSESPTDAVRTSRKIFRRGCADYLGELSYTLVSNIIPLPILFNHLENSTNIYKMAELFAKIANDNQRLKDFAKELGYDTVTLNKVIDVNIEKMEIYLKKGLIYDKITNQPISFLDADERSRYDYCAACPNFFRTEEPA